MLDLVPRQRLNREIRMRVLDPSFLSLLIFSAVGFEVRFPDSQQRPNFRKYTPAQAFPRWESEVSHRNRLKEQ